MRTTVLILAVLGAVCSLILGIKWSSDYSKYKDVIAISQSLADSLPATEKAEMEARLAEVESTATASKMLMVSAVLAIAGGVLMFRKMTVPAAAVLAVAGIVPVFFSGKTLLTTTFILIAAVLAVLYSRKASAGATPAPVAI